MNEADNFRDENTFILAYERGLVRQPWRRKVAKEIISLRQENEELKAELEKLKAKPKSKPKPKASDDAA